MGRGANPREGRVPPEAVGFFAAHGRFLEFLKKVLVKGKKLCYTVLDKIIYGVAIVEEIC